MTPITPHSRANEHVTRTAAGALAAQRQFEALFAPGYVPKTDTRTPAQVKAGTR